MVRYLIASVLIVAILGIFFLPIEIPYVVSLPGRLYPTQEWFVIKDRDGNLSTSLRDYESGSVHGYLTHRFERGDAVRITFPDHILPHTMVTAGDTVLKIFSNQTQQDLVRLRGELASAEALLALYAAGEKQAVIDEAEMLLQRSLESVEQQTREVDRLRRLWDRQLIAEEEYEIAESQRQLFEADMAVAEARLEAVKTGAKPEQIALTRTEQAALRAEIAQLQHRVNLFAVTTPITGKAVRNSGGDTLLTIQDMSRLSVVLPVPWREHRFLQKDQTFRINLADGETDVTARFLQLGESIQLLNDEQVLLVTGVLDETPEGVFAGALVSCDISLGNTSLWEYIRRTFDLTL